MDPQPDRTEEGEPPTPPAPVPDDAGERRVIEALLAARPPRPDWVRLDAGHDCAVLADGLALTVDTMVEGIHFDARLAPEDVGYKAVAVSVSDLIAARARPRWMLLALSVPRSWSADRRQGWVRAFSTGIAAAAGAWGVYLLGGDVTGVPAEGPVFVSTTLGGLSVDAPRGRAGAGPGDRLWVTGWPGLAGAGWMSDDPPPEAVGALRRPDLPLEFGLGLADATAAMDLSDGLGADLPRLAEASGVRIALDADAIPAHPAIAGHPERLRWQIRGGDDFQLLFTAPPGASDAIAALGRRTSTPVHAIGRVERGRGVALEGAEWPPAAFSHFGGAT